MQFVRTRLVFAGSLLWFLVVGLIGRPVPCPGVEPLSGTGADSRDRARVEALLGKLPLYFVENRGQEDPRVAYSVPGRDATVYLTPDGVTFALTRPASRRSSRGSVQPATLRQDSAPRERWAVKLKFLGANPAVVPRGQEPSPAVVSYFKGPDSRWKTGLKTYASVLYADLWPGIDLVYGGNSGRLKYTFHVKPGADPGRIRLAYEGATSVALNQDGQIEVATPAGGFSDDKPYAYQEADGRRVEVATAYALARDSHTYGFRVGSYDRSRPLVLDPSVLVYAGYIGGSGRDVATAIAIDSAGNAYVAGFTDSTVPSFPGIAGPDLTQGGNADAFVAKVRADGTGLVYAGYIGGADVDLATGIAVDSAGNAYVAGFTDSDETTFPVRVGPDLIHNGDVDGFVAKVRPDGTSLVYCGYIGGAEGDSVAGIDVDNAGNAYVTGSTTSDQTTFPVRVGPDLVYNDDLDAFVAKVKADGTVLVYCGYIGGAGDDRANGIAVNGSGNAFVAGSTLSDQITFPVIVGPSLTYSGGDVDGFVAKVKADGTGLAYAGYVGGEDFDTVTSIAVDSPGSAYLAGITESDQTTFPVKVGPDLTHNGGVDAFVAKVKADGTGLVYAGYVGGAGLEEALGIAADSAGSAYVAGSTDSDPTTFRLFAGPFLTKSGVRDAFVTKVKADGTGVLYSGYIGGFDFDRARAIVVDSAGNAYLAGETRSGQASFPVAVGPDLIFNGGQDDAFVLKISGRPDLTVFLVDAAANVVKPGDSINAFDRVRNQALGTAPASTTRYYFSVNSVRDAGDILLAGNHSTPILLPGNQILGAATVSVPSNTPLGTYRLLACADDTNAIAELDETNNCLALSARTLQVTRPDLQAVPLQNPPQTATAGQTIQVQDNTFNEGLVAVAGSTTRYYLSVDSVKGAGDILLTGSRSVPGLAAGANSNGGLVTVVIPSNTAPNTYRLMPCADDLNAVIETIETNNCRASVGTVTVSAQVGGFELDPRSATVVAGEPLSYRFQWIHPIVWRNLTNLQLRFADQADGRVIFRVLWDETSNTFRLVDDNGNPAGRAELPGSNTTLQNGNAILRLAQTTVVPDGPTSGIVTLTLAMTFKSEAAGQGRRDYRVEVLATDDSGLRQGFDPAGSLRVLRTLPAAATLEGKATGVGSGKDNASIEMKGEFTPPNAVGLDQATLTLASLLDEVGGTGELTRGQGGAALLPLVLTARAGGKPTEAIYETASGVRPGVRVEVKVRDSRTGLMEFSIEVDRATIPAGPALCSAVSPATTGLRTHFELQVGGGVPVVLDLTQHWRCSATELETP